MTEDDIIMCVKLYTTVEMCETACIVIANFNIFLLPKSKQEHEMFPRGIFTSLDLFTTLL